MRQLAGRAGRLAGSIFRWGVFQFFAAEAVGRKVRGIFCSARIFFRNAAEWWFSLEKEVRNMRTAVLTVVSGEFFHQILDRKRWPASRRFDFRGNFQFHRPLPFWASVFFVKGREVRPESGDVCFFRPAVNVSSKRWNEGAHPGKNFRI